MRKSSQLILIVMIMVCWGRAVRGEHNAGGKYPGQLEGLVEVGLFARCYFPKDKGIDSGRIEKEILVDMRKSFSAAGFGDLELSSPCFSITVEGTGSLCNENNGRYVLWIEACLDEEVLLVRNPKIKMFGETAITWSQSFMVDCSRAELDEVIKREARFLTEYFIDSWRFVRENSRKKQENKPLNNDRSKRQPRLHVTQ